MNKPTKTINTDMIYILGQFMIICYLLLSQTRQGLSQVKSELITYWIILIFLTIFFISIMITYCYRKRKNPEKPLFSKKPGIDALLSFSCGFVSFGLFLFIVSDKNQFLLLKYLAGITLFVIWLTLFVNSLNDKKILIKLLLAILFIAICLGFLVDTLKVKKVDIETLEASYRQNTFLANLKYKYRTLEMDCVVVDIEPYQDGESQDKSTKELYKKLIGGTWVSFSKNYDDSFMNRFGKVRTFFFKDRIDQLKNLNIGDHVTLRGQTIDWISFVLMKNCTLDVKYIK